MTTIAQIQSAYALKQQRVAIKEYGAYVNLNLLKMTVDCTYPSTPYGVQLLTGAPTPESTFYATLSTITQTYITAKVGEIDASLIALGVALP